MNGTSGTPQFLSLVYNGPEIVHVQAVCMNVDCTKSGNVTTLQVLGEGNGYPACSSPPWFASARNIEQGMAASVQAL